MSKKITISTSSLKKKKITEKITEKEVIKKNWEDLKRISKENQGVNVITKNSINPFTNKISGNPWKGKRCFLIGGGESVNDFNFNLIKHDMTIGINMAFMKLDPTIIFSMDNQFYKWVLSGYLGKEAKDKFIKSKSYKAILNMGKENIDKSIYQINCKGENGISINLAEGIYNGNNSGYAALNLAICLGAEKIYLVGFDMKGRNGKQAWFHKGYGENLDQGEEVYKKFIKYFEDISEQLKDMGIEVINLSQDSELKCFKFGNEETIIEDNKNYPLYMEGYAGIGDNFWQRPFLKEIAKKRPLYLGTFTPQVYYDVDNIKCVRLPYKAFKSHNRISDNVNNEEWYKKPDNAIQIEKPLYWEGFKEGYTLTTLYEKYYPIEKYDYSFPVKKEWEEAAKKIIDTFDNHGKKICLIHFPTKRREWKCPAREPKIEYLQMLINRYREEYYYVSLADLTNEDFYIYPENIDKEFHHGELLFEELLGMIKLSDMIITGNCYLFPMGLAIEGPKVFCVGGGCQDLNLFLDKRMDLNDMELVSPDPFCNCCNPGHDCYKDIPEQKIINKFENLMNKKKKKKNILIYKVGRKYWSGFRKNKELNKKYNLIFEMNDIQDIEKYLYDNEIKKVISVLYPYEELKDICQRNNVDWIFCEAFLGKNCTFDRTGAHFSPDNDIKKYIDIIPAGRFGRQAIYTKMDQPKEIGKKEFYNKYSLSKKEKYIVLFGQEIDDKSIIHSKNPLIKNYKDYISMLVMNNLDTKFLFKIHPVYKTFKSDKSHVMEFIYNYKNIIPVYENIDTLFEVFDKFTAYSSTTIFEGLIRNKKFASVGYHFCDNDKIVYQMIDKNSFIDLYTKLEDFEINEKVKKKYINFIYNYYVVDLESEQLVKRLEQDSSLYFNGDKE